MWLFSLNPEARAGKEKFHERVMVFEVKHCLRRKANSVSFRASVRHVQNLEKLRPGAVAYLQYEVRGQEPCKEYFTVDCASLRFCPLSESVVVRIEYQPLLIEAVS